MSDVQHLDDVQYPKTPLQHRLDAMVIGVLTGAVHGAALAGLKAAFSGPIELAVVIHTVLLFATGGLLLGHRVNDFYVGLARRTCVLLGDYQPAFLLEPPLPLRRHEPLMAHPIRTLAWMAAASVLALF